MKILLIALLLFNFSHTAFAEGKGTVKIVTDPGDAKIYVDGKRKGNSASEKGQTFAIKLPEGEYVLEAIKPAGAKEHYAKKEIFVAEDTLQTISLILAKRSNPDYLKKLKAKY